MPGEAGELSANRRQSERIQLRDNQVTAGRTSRFALLEGKGLFAVHDRASSRRSIVPALLRKVGSRFDAEIGTAFTMYWLRGYIMEFVAHRLVGAKEGEGGKILESAVFVQGTIL
jgi:hypothetical protein